MRQQNMTQRQRLMSRIARAGMIGLTGPVCLLASCTKQPTGGDSQPGGCANVPTVTVSLAPHAGLVSDIAGERMKVVTLMPKGGDPETYDPTVSDIRRLSSSRLYLMAGNMAFEQRVASQLPDSVQAVDLSEGIDLLFGTHTHGAGDSHGHGHDHHHGLTVRHTHADGTGHTTAEVHHHHDPADPHTWTSLRNGKIIVANIVTALSTADPEGADYYAERGACLTQRIDSLDSVYSAALAPLKGRTFLIWHPSLSYLARDYGLHQHTLLQENKEHSVKSLKTTLDNAAATSPMILLLQPESDIPVARSTASSLGVPVEVINPLNPDWIAEMTHTLEVLSKQ